MSQGDLAVALGMNRVTVSDMERAAAPIETRTALATLHVIDMKEAFPWRSPLAEGDVPIADAVILWESDGTVQPPVTVRWAGGEDDRRYSSSNGAAMMGWRAGSSLSRIVKLFALVQEMTVVEGIDSREVHTALSVIPEYRACLAPVDGFGLELGIEGE